MLFTRARSAPYRPVVRSSCLALIVLAGCVKADDPELFRPDPMLLNDYTLSLPTRGSSGGLEYEIIQGFAVFEGDILLGTVNADGNLKSTIRSRGLARSDFFGRWPDGIVPYTPPTRNSAIQQEKIAQAIEHWMENTSITFVERTEENADQYPNFLRFDSTNSCASFVGMQGGEQSIMVSDACSMGSVVHEIGHALGLFHEHTRPDRDNFAQIEWDEIVDGKEINFNILTAGVENVGPYDYGSIMHYGEYFFSATGKRTIIVPDGVSVGQRDGLSANDAESIDLMYATDLALLQPTANTTDAGLEIGVSIANQGSLGAHELELAVSIADDAQWQGISRDSGWECATIGVDLRCTRATMSEQTESRFTLLVNTDSGSSDTLSMNLTSRTVDINPGNNVLNDDLSSSPDPAQRTNSEPEPEPASNPMPFMPTVAAANSGGAASEDGASAGSDNGVILSLALAALAWRRRRPLSGFPA